MTEDSVDLETFSVEINLVAFALEEKPIWIIKNTALSL